MKNNAMNCLPVKQAQKTLAWVVALFLATAAAKAAPDPREIMTNVREIIQAQETSVSGQLRTGAQKTPFSLKQEGGVSVYRFTSPAETIHVTFDDKGSSIDGVKDPRAAIRGSILSYDDLALRFLYWKDIQYVGQEKIRSLPCWHLRLTPSSRASQYAIVHLWVNVQTGAFLRADAYDWEGNKVKQFQVISTQSVGNKRFLRQMRIQNMRPSDPMAETITYLEINEAK
ncbi:MAG TPA: outer membrane lipoprotein-sorting protein [Chthoniobacterales bacterium]